jgi:hypothetical protein
MISDQVRCGRGAPAGRLPRLRVVAPQPQTLDCDLVRQDPAPIGRTDLSRLGQPWQPTAAGNLAG